MSGFQSQGNEVIDTEADRPKFGLSTVARVPTELSDESTHDINTCHNDSSLSVSRRPSAHDTLRQLMEMADLSKMPGLRDVILRKTSISTPSRVGNEGNARSPAQVSSPQDQPSEQFTSHGSSSGIAGSDQFQESSSETLPGNLSNPASSSHSINASDVRIRLTSSSRNWSNVSSYSTTDGSGLEEDDDDDVVGVAALQRRLGEIKGLLTVVGTGTASRPTIATSTSRTDASASKSSSVSVAIEVSSGDETSGRECDRGTSSSSGNFDDVLKKFGWARGMLRKMDKLDEDFPSTDSSTV